MGAGYLYLFLCCVLTRAHDPLGNDISGDNQIGIVNQFLNQPVVVRIMDEKGKGLENVPVVFIVLKEPQENKITNKFAVIQPETTYTDKDGFAKTFVRLGNARGDYYILCRQNGETLLFHFTGMERDWVLLMVISVIGGLALFIFALNYGSKGLIRGFGSKTRDLLFNLTNNRLTSLVGGFFVTIIFGSCTATASLLIKFASAGVVQLIPGLAVMLGANIGATITIQILAFNIMNYALLIITIGVFLRILFPNLRNLAQFIFGIGLLFFSLKIISTGIGSVKYISGFTKTVDYLNNAPVLAIFIGALTSFIFRSSTAVIGLVLVLTLESAISTMPALHLLFGANLGTTIFPILLSDSANARRITLGNFICKFVGVLVFVILFDYIKIIPFFENNPRQIASIHTIFNIVVALIFLPLLSPFSKFLNFLVVETKQEILKSKRLDQSFLDAPAIATGQAMKEILDMGYKTIKMLEDAIRVFEKRDIVLRKTIIQSDDEIDQVEEMVTPYLSRLNPEEMDQELRKMQIGLLTITSELEHIGDTISKSLMNYAKKQIDEGMEFSQEGLAQIREFHRFVLDTLKMAISSLATRDRRLAQDVVSRRDTGLKMVKDFELKHIERLQRGLKESLETSTIHLDILSDLERINFHATEIAEAVIGIL
uniref:Na/Pi cotransporter family protein n=1 Tax=candidate division WOR-3 bacterium TaxID=2052148 RepID=A0A7C6AGH5_UNCW3